MTEPVYLDPATEEVRSLLARSLEQTTDAPERLAIRCKACGRKVSRVVATSHGPGFWSEWETDEPIDYQVIVNGDVVAEIIVLLWGNGKKVLEIPYLYVPREQGESKARIFKFGLAYLETLYRLWRRFK